MIKLKALKFSTVVGEITALVYERELIYIGLNEEETNILRWLSQKLLPIKIYYVEDCIDIKEKITGYLKGRRKALDLPYKLTGTEFQKKVWQALTDIPYGQTHTYKQVANTIGYTTGYQAVGQAIGKNPLPILIPCHRVIGSSGKLTGYSGGLDIKRTLLQIESKL